MDEAVVAYWMAHYVVKDHCGLCGNTGIIEMRQVITPAGVSVHIGRDFWCICPNGQSLRDQMGERVRPIRSMAS